MSCYFQGGHNAAELEAEVIEHDCFPKNVKCCTFIYSQLFYCQHSVFEVWTKVCLIRKNLLKMEFRSDKHKQQFVNLWKMYLIFKNLFIS